MPTLTTVSTRGSTFSTATTDKNTRTLFGAIKAAFKTKHKHSGGKESHRFSTLSIGSSDSRKRTEEEELERRRATCLAIKSAKREPEEVQRLLVDCEFCNPPPKYGLDLPIVTPQFTAGNVHTPTDKELAEYENQPEEIWNTGLKEWLRMRECWNTPTPNRQPKHHLDADVSPDRYFVIYNKFVRFTRPLKKPLNLDDILKIVKAGWVGEGEWSEDRIERWSDEESAGEGTDMVSARRTQSASRGADLRTPSMRPEREDNSDHSPGHVQFHDTPHPKLAIKSNNKSTDQISHTMTNANNSSLTLMPTRSNHSSLISLTDDN